MIDQGPPISYTDQNTRLATEAFRGKTPAGGALLVLCYLVHALSGMIFISLELLHH